ncbi:MAG: DamX protein [Cellvibrionaceae bacterium]|jgi:DamX protein
MSHDVGSASVTDRIDAPQPVNQFSTSPHAIGMNALPDPFSPSMNHVFFSGSDRRILLDEVIHLCQFGNNLVAAIGDDGVGKTTFLNQARFELSETAFCCFINSDESMTPENIFSQIISQLELPVSSVPSAGEMIATLRHAMAEGSMNRVVVIIDDAHMLNDSILSALISLLQGHQGQHLHILMSGQKSLVDRLDHFDMFDVLVYDVTLNPFTSQDTKEYLDFKLTAAGYPSEKLLDERQVESIWNESEGYPAQISRVADRHIFQQDFDIEEENSSAPGLPLIHMALLVVLLAGLILALIYMGNDDGDTSDDSIESQGNVEVLTGLNSASQKAVENGLVGPSGIEPNKPSNLLKIKAGGSTEIGLNKGASLLRGQDLAFIGGAASEQSAAKVLPSESRNKSPLVKPIKGAEPVNLALPSLPQSSQLALQESLKQELKKEAELLRIEQSNLTTTENSLPKTIEVSKSREAKASTSLSEDKEWLLSLNDSEYVLQVIAAAQKKSVKRFIVSQPNKSALRLVEIGRDGKPWYIVVVGKYASSNFARRAIESLPQDQVNRGPWPRKVSDLKREISAPRTK